MARPGILHLCRYLQSPIQRRDRLIVCHIKDLELVWYPGGAFAAKGDGTKIYITGTTVLYRNFTARVDEKYYIRGNAVYPYMPIPEFLLMINSRLESMYT